MSLSQDRVFPYCVQQTKDKTLSECDLLWDLEQNIHDPSLFITP